MQLKSGAILQGGRYRIVDSLGRGGFGVTYLAEQVSLHRRVCIKEFFPKDYYKRDGDTGALTLSSDGFAESMNKFKAKFVKEAQTIAALDHHNIIPIYDVFEENNTAYYVMEYIDGVSLSRIVKESGALSEDVAVGYIKQIASALAHIHERKINHLDVKPGNIMVRRDDDRAILIDFGLSKHYDNAGEQTSSTPVGISHGFAPIEQYKQGGVSSFSPTTDIYALGATLYYLVTGSVPPSATDVGEDGLPALPKHLSSSLCKAVEVSMSYWRKDRPQTIKAFVALLDGCGASKIAVADESTVISAAASDDEKTKIVTPQPTPQPKIERPKSKTPIEPAPKQKRSRWWLWLVIIFATPGGIYYGIGKYLQSEGKGFYGVYDVGDYFNRGGKEGVVFEVWDNGRHGKIVSLDEAEAVWDSRIEWSDSERKFINGTKTGANDMSNGKANTDKVMQRSDSDRYRAFVWCRNKGGDWYLPAIGELEAIYNNRSAINSTLAEYNAEQMDVFYLSSTEYENNPKFCAWGVQMRSEGKTGIGDKDDDDSYVRAVSDF